jgi:hypothetical protein
MCKTFIFEHISMWITIKPGYLAIKKRYISLPIGYTGHMDFISQLLLGIVLLVLGIVINKAVDKVLARRAFRKSLHTDFQTRGSSDPSKVINNHTL